MVDSITAAPAGIPKAPVLPAAGSSPILPNPAPEVSNVTDQVSLSTAASQQPGQPKVQYADPQVLGTTSFSLYKAANGEFVTRTVDEETGKVTYSPQDLPVMGGDTSSSPVLDITA